MSFGCGFSLPAYYSAASGLGMFASASLFLDFTSGNQTLDPRITFTRGSNATRFNSAGTLVTMSNNQPRFDYDPVTKQPKGLLIEEQRTNLLTYSESFDNAAWGKTRSTITANAVTSPDGTTSADKLVEDTTAASTHFTTVNIAFTSGTYYAFFVFAKSASGNRNLRIQLNSGAFAANTYATFDLSAISYVISGGVISAAMSNVGNGWYRCSVVALANATATTQAILFLDNGTGVAYTGDGTSGLYIWGAQLEAGSFPTSYIPSADSFTSRASQGSFIGSNGLVQYSGTNLLTYSEQFDNAAWAKTRASISANATTAPDGTITADKLVEDATASNTHAVNSSFSATSGLTYTASVYVKAGERTECVLQLTSAFAATTSVRVNLSTGLVLNTSGTPVNSGVDPLGNGWYRVYVAQTASATTTALAIVYISKGGTTSYTGDGTSGIYIWGAQLEAGQKAGTYRQTTTTAITANPARYNYNPLNLTLAPKLLLEEQRTNLLTYSEQFDNAAWAKTNATVSANAVVAPDGTTTADKLVEDTTSTAAHHILVTQSVTSGTSYTLSIYARAAERSILTVSLANQFPANAFANFNLSTGTITAGGGLTSSSATSVGNGWYRCSITATASSTASAWLVFYLNNGSTLSYTGDGTSGIYIWGAQLEQGAYPTSYIPTTTAQVTRAADVSSSAQTTRAADVATMTGTNFSSWYNQSEGTFVVSSLRSVDVPPGQYPTIFRMRNDVTGLDALTAYAFLTSGQNRYSVDMTTGGVSQFSLGSSSPLFSIPAGQNAVLSVGYKTNDCAASMNGSTVVTDTVATMMTGITSLNIGISSAGASPLNGHISRLAYYPRRLSNTELQGITS